jgi:hypothetical protein
MRCYKLMDARFALDALANRRLKISTLKDLNDPFELLAADLRSASHRRAFEQFRHRLAEQSGVLCFSTSWRSPMLWSHYAEKHFGVCLGFEVPDSHLARVRYEARRLPDVAATLLAANDDEKTKLGLRLLTTKYAEWKYEREVRVFTTLSDPDPTTGLFFTAIGRSLALREIVFGPRFISPTEPFAEAARQITSDVEVLQARLAFKSFAVVEKKGSRHAA